MSKIEIEKLEQKLERCKNICIDEVDKNEIEDISKININKRKSSKDRILDFLNSVSNPYIFKVNGKLVKIEFSNNTRTAESCITNVIKSIYE